MSYACKTAALCLAKSRGGGLCSYLKLLRDPHVSFIRSRCVKFAGEPYIMASYKYAKQTQEPIVVEDATILPVSQAATAKQRSCNNNGWHGDRVVLFHRPTGHLVSMKVKLDEKQQPDVGSVPLKDVCRLMNTICVPGELNVDITDHDRRVKASKPTSTQPTSSGGTVRLVNAIRPVDLDWHKQAVNIKKLPRWYMLLSKIRLTGLVVLTEMGGYAMAPGPFDPVIFILAALGTAGLSCAANTMNQFFEVPFDSQMARTKNRVLVRALISPLHAVTFAVTSATLGLAVLGFGINGITAGLGAFNLFLYTSVYTPIKRVSIANTWIGSVVGAIPPVMGWTACTGTIDAGGLLLGAILFAWQFPHFNALSWNLRGDYSRAGYRMMSVTDPDLCRRTALRYSCVMLGLCTLAPVVELTTWTFAVDSFPLNAALIYFAWQFHKNADSASSRQLFRFSLVHLPALILLLLISKKHYGQKQVS